MQHKSICIITGNSSFKPSGSSSKKQQAPIFMHKPLKQSTIVNIYDREALNSSQQTISSTTNANTSINNTLDMDDDDEDNNLNQSSSLVISNAPSSYPHAATTASVISTMSSNGSGKQRSLNLVESCCSSSSSSKSSSVLSNSAIHAANVVEHSHHHHNQHQTSLSKMSGPNSQQISVAGQLAASMPVSTTSINSGSINDDGSATSEVSICFFVNMLDSSLFLGIVLHK